MGGGGLPMVATGHRRRFRRALFAPLRLPEVGVDGQRGWKHAPSCWSVRAASVRRPRFIWPLPASARCAGRRRRRRPQQPAAAGPAHGSARSGSRRSHRPRSRNVAHSIRARASMPSSERLTQRQRRAACSIGVDVVHRRRGQFPGALSAQRCLRAACGNPLVYGAVHRSRARSACSMRAASAAIAPCYRCLFPNRRPPRPRPNCAEAGVLGVLPGVIGLLQATEAIKLMLGIGESLAGRVAQLRCAGDALPRDAACTPIRSARCARRRRALARLHRLRAFLRRLSRLRQACCNAAAQPRTPRVAPASRPSGASPSTPRTARRRRARAPRPCHRDAARLRRLRDTSRRGNCGRSRRAIIRSMFCTSGRSCIRCSSRRRNAAASIGVVLDIRCRHGGPGVRDGQVMGA